MSNLLTAEDPATFDCQSCGACCAYSEDWPRFSLETDEELDRIPEALVAEDLGGMRCPDNRCAALSGEIGKHVACTIYEIRPIVCRTCMPGDPECLMARETLPKPDDILDDPAA
ncbi:hypothetical protein SAMN05880582_10331 [Rhizobium sp. RU20A]|uniref:YkgJ family cysteine cluster protein n=1 Tax=Rhizobium sp. RU20A TaxID=1907412 RepID=UPI0009542BB2|nr:YkgJ family cysteine cluster protein [Rhizobium sp. RU20A]SIQ68901.1 hypothetical protein SAMN05880582_10331 [Rhizobium sp. RU20A]